MKLYFTQTLVAHDNSNEVLN